MSDHLFSQLGRVREDLTALVGGGLAVGIQARPRTTVEADAAVALESDAVAERLVMALRALGYSLRVPIEHVAMNRLAAVRFVSAGARSLAPNVDLLSLTGVLSLRSYKLQGSLIAKLLAKPPWHLLAA